MAAGLLLIGLIIARQQLRHLRDQMKEDTYLEYSKRYNEIAKQLPTEVFGQNFETAQLDRSPEFRHAMKAYVDLCSEEVKLACRDKIPYQVWQDWEEEIRDAMGSPAGRWAQKSFDFGREYKTLRLFLEGKGQGLPIARTEYERVKTWSLDKFT